MLQVHGTSMMMKLLSHGPVALMVIFCHLALGKVKEIGYI